MDHEIKEAIETVVSRTIDQVLWHLPTEHVDRYRVREIIPDCDQLETDTDGLDLDQKLEIIELGADECGLDSLDFDLDGLRNFLDAYTLMAIHRIGESRAASMFEDLFDFMDGNGLEPEQMRAANPCSWMASHSEREEGPDCTVYEYRHVEAQGCHIDVWKYRLPSGHRVWLIDEPQTEP